MTREQAEEIAAMAKCTSRLVYDIANELKDAAEPFSKPTHPAQTPAAQGVTTKSVRQQEGGDDEDMIGVGGIMQGIGAAEKAGLQRYLERLPSKYEHLSMRSVCEISLPEGGIAKGYSAEDACDIWQAYADSLVEGGLHASKLTLAERRTLRLRRMLHNLDGVKILILVEGELGNEMPLHLRGRRGYLLKHLDNRHAST